MAVGGGQKSQKFSSDKRKEDSCKSRVLMISQKRNIGKTREEGLSEREGGGSKGIGGRKGRIPGRISRLQGTLNDDSLAADSMTTQERAPDSKILSLDKERGGRKGKKEFEEKVGNGSPMGYRQISIILSEGDWTPPETRRRVQNFP